MSTIPLPKRVAILTDIHANKPALTHVLDFCASEGVEAYWCLGDTMGRGDMALSTLEAIKNVMEQSEANICLAGDHDWALTGRLPFENFMEIGDREISGGIRQDLAQRIVYQRELLEHYNRQDLIDWLKKAEPFQQVDRLSPWKHLRGYFLAHGYTNPVDMRQAMMTYTRDAVLAKMQVDLLRREFPESPPRVIAFGHTHRLKLWTYRSGDARATEINEALGEWQSFHVEETTLVINAGSVGIFPKNNPRPSFVLLDIDSPTQVKVKLCQPAYR